LDAPGVIPLIILLVLLLLSAFFAAAETAFSQLNRARLSDLAEEGSKSAARAIKMLDKNRVDRTLLLCNSIVNLTAASIATLTATKVNMSMTLAIALLTLAIIFCGEILPKKWAVTNPEKIALAFSGIVNLLMIILTPVVVLTDMIANVFLKLFHIDPKGRATITEDDLRSYVEVSHEDGVIESEEREMIYNLFDFSEAQAKDIMTPRVNMVTISVDATYDEIIAIFRKCMYTRLPVYEEDNDNIIGLINIKDFILAENTDSFEVRDFLREAHYTYEYKKVTELLYELREKATSMTFVLNEYGATVGMITLEDLLEEIVGDIRDEYDEDEAERLKQIEERVWLAEASMQLLDINDALDTDLDSEDYDSIGGLIIEALDRLPVDNEEVTLADGTRLKVQGIDMNRIVKVLITLPEPAPADEEDED
jgi:CBS domain containing-hemolysin-like protein